MARTVERIEQDLAALEVSLGAIAQEFEDVYSQYLEDLGTVVSQQLILATYHLCTQGYPEPFLALSLPQRQDMQQSIRQLARSASCQFLAYLKPAEPSLDELKPVELSLGEPDSLGEAAIAPADAVPAEPPLSPDEPAAILMAALDVAELLTLEAPSDPIRDPRLSPLPLPSDDPLEQLTNWQERIEQGIMEVLQGLSYGANRILHQINILPHRLPEPILEVATKSGMAAETAVGSPNLMHLVIEAKSDEMESADVIRVMAIRLRLSEVEFANPTLATWRSRLRDLNARLNRIGKDYRKKQKERAIAQAELAWRSSWYDD